MALGILMIMTIGMGAFSILGLILLYLVKGDKASKVIFYIMAVWGLVVAVFSALSAPSNWMLTQVVSWGFGFLSVAGIITEIAMKREGRCVPAYILITVSVIGGMAAFIGLFS